MDGDLGDMYYVTSLNHSTFDIHDGETAQYQILAEDTLDYQAKYTAVIIRTLMITECKCMDRGWYNCNINSANNGNQTWQGHESIFSRAWPTM